MEWCWIGRRYSELGKDEELVKRNGFYYIPPDMEHGVRVLEGPLYALDLFISLREDYKKYFVVKKGDDE